LDDDEPLLGGWDDAARRLVAMATASGALRDSLSQARYLASKNAAYYRTVLDVLVEEESRLGLHLSTSEIHRRCADQLAAVVKTYVGFPDVGPLLDQLHKWGNVDRIANTQRKGSVQEFFEEGLSVSNDACWHDRASRAGQAGRRTRQDRLLAGVAAAGGPTCVSGARRRTEEHEDR